MTKRKKGPTPPDSPVFLRLSADERRRLKLACVESDMPYSAFVMAAVERHEKRKAARPAIAASPLHAGFEDE